MSIEENLIARSSQADKISNLQRELEAALILIKNYEALIDDMKLENSNNLKKIAHDISNPLQILCMTIEATQDNPPQNMDAALSRMKKATDNIMSIVTSIRKARTLSVQSPINADIKVV